MKIKDILLEDMSNSEVAAAAAAIDKAITSVDDSMSYKVFALAVAKILKDEYGSHNFASFMKVLHSDLGINENSTKVLKDRIESHFESTYSEYSPYVDCGEYSGGRADDDPRKGRGYGKITFRYKDDIPEDVFEKMKKDLESFGTDITNSGRYYDYEPGERDFYPTIKFDYSL